MAEPKLCIGCTHMVEHPWWWRWLIPLPTWWQFSQCNAADFVMGDGRGGTRSCRVYNKDGDCDDWETKHAESD